jgi:hypothetical protein
MSLILHCGANAITRTELAEVPTPRALGRFHQPVPFIDFVDQVSDALQVVGLRVADERYGLQHDGSRFFGIMELQAAGARDYALTVGLRGSHDQSVGRGLVAGSRVFVCDNMAFSGEVRISTKQTLNITRRLPGLVLDAVRNLAGVFEVQDARFAQYRDCELKPRWGDAAITELVRRGVLNPTQVGRVIEQWDRPAHDEHAHNGWSVWRFFNGVTEALKVPLDDHGLPVRANAPMLMERTIGLTAFLDEVAKFKPATVH